MKFEYIEDEEFFKKLLCSGEETLEKYKSIFDFRSPKVKRIEFNKVRNEVFRKIKALYGKVCILEYPKICNPKSGFVLDHLIPLSSNKLNKELRKIKAVKGKKVQSQSFGSNHLNNLIMACKKCNSHKKHRFLKKEKIQHILRFKSIKH